MHVRFQSSGFVERPDAHEPEIRSAPIVAPDSRLTLGAAVDIMRAVLAWYRHGYWFAADQLNCLGLDNRIEHERAACQPLAIVAMTTVDEHRLGEELVANGSAGTAATKIFAMLTDKRNVLEVKVEASAISLEKAASPPPRSRKSWSLNMIFSVFFVSFVVKVCCDSAAT